VVIDIAIMEVSTDRLHTIGTTVPTSTSIALQAAPAGVGTVNIGALNGGTFAMAVPGRFHSPFSCPTATPKFFRTREFASLDKRKSYLENRRPGANRYRFRSRHSRRCQWGGISPLVNTQFQYLDVGVNIDITPHILSGGEVNLKMVLEVSTVTGSTDIGVLASPQLEQRHIEHETRLGDGEMSLVGGILEDQKPNRWRLSWLGNIPLLKYLFGQEKKDRRKTEIVFAVIPHIVRSEVITDESMRLIDIGTGTAIDLRRPELTKKPAPPPQPVKPVSQGERHRRSRSQHLRDLPRRSTAGVFAGPQGYRWGSCGLPAESGNRR